MRVDRRLVSLLLVALAGVSLGVATAWMSDSGTFNYTVTAAAPEGDGGDRIWTCKLAGPPAEPKLAPGQNPLQVSVNSVDAQDAFSDAHPSYVVESGEIVCVEPDTEAAAPTQVESEQATDLGSEPDEATADTGSTEPEESPDELTDDETTSDSEEDPGPDE